MAERIVPATPSLAKREQRAINDLRTLFPDGNVSGLDSRDKQLGARLTALYRALGYATRGEMIEALGFTQARSRSSGGRPVTVVPDDLFEELARRYEGRAKPKSIGILKHDNPDLASKIKTVNNKCPEIYGHTMTVELVSRGLLDKNDQTKRAPVSDNEIRSAVAQLEEKYSAISNKPKTIAQLKRLEPEYTTLFDSLTSARCRAMFGMSTAVYFKKVGILLGDAHKVDDRIIQSTLDTLQKQYQHKPNKDKPKTVKALLDAHPEFADVLKAGQKSGAATRESLLERGILGLSKQALANKTKLLKQRCARNATVVELVRLYHGSGSARVILPGDNDERLRSGVVGIDLDNGYELRETIFVLDSPDLSVGDELSFSWEQIGGWIAGRRLVLLKSDARVGRVSRLGSDDFLDYRDYDTESPLVDEVGTVVIKVEKLGEHDLARVRHRFITPISRETMLYALYQIDALTESELCDNDDSWRERLEKLPEDFFADARPINERAVSTSEEELGGAEQPHGEMQGGKADELSGMAKDEKASDDGVNSERQTIISTLKLLVLASGMAGAPEYPQDILDELDRAEKGDTSVDLEDLARRFNELTPEFKSADLSNVSFSQCRRAKGRRFSIAIPDGWTVVENYEEESILGTMMRPFVAVQGVVNDPSGVQNQDRIIYSAQGDIEVDPIYAECGTNDLRWALMMNARYDKNSNDGMLAFRPTVVWDEEVDAVNTRCFLSQNKPNDGANGLEIYIAPYALDHGDFIRLVLTYKGDESVAQARELARAIARTVELDKRIVPTCEKTLDESLRRKVSADEFCKMVESYVKPYIALRQSIFQSYQYKYATNHEGFSDDEITLAGARGIAELVNRAVPVLSRIVDAYGVQVAHGASDDDRRKMLDAIDAFDGKAFPTADIFEEADSVVLVKSAHVFDPTEELIAVRARIAKAKEELATSTVGEPKATKKEPAKTNAAGKAPTPQPSGPKPAKRRGARALKIDDVLAALDRLCDADTFVDSKELAAALEGKPRANQVHRLLANAFEESKVRRAYTGRKYLYSRLLTSEEWNEKLKELNERFEKEDAKHKAKQKEARIAKLRAQLKRTRSKLGIAVGTKKLYEQRLEGYERGRDVATKECEILRTAQSEATAEVSRIEGEISGLGLFAFFKKKELNVKLQAELEKLNQLQERLEKASNDLIVVQKRYNSVRSEFESVVSTVSSREADVHEIEESLAEAEQAEGIVELSAEEKRARIVEVASYWGLPLSSKWCADNVPGVTVRTAASALGYMTQSGDAAKLGKGRYAIQRAMPIGFVVDQLIRASGRGAIKLSLDRREHLKLAVRLYDIVPASGGGVSAFWLKQYCRDIDSTAKASAVMHTAIQETGYFESIKTHDNSTNVLYRKLVKPNP